MTLRALVDKPDDRRRLTSSISSHRARANGLSAIVYVAVPGERNDVALASDELHDDPRGTGEGAVLFAWSNGEVTGPMGANTIAFGMHDERERGCCDGQD